MVFLPTLALAVVGEGLEIESAVTEVAGDRSIGQNIGSYAAWNCSAYTVDERTHKALTGVIDWSRVVEGSQTGQANIGAWIYGSTSYNISAPSGDQPVL